MTADSVAHLGPFNRLPEGWSAIPLRRLISALEQGWSPNAHERVADEGEWAVLKLGAVSQGRFRAEQHKALIEGTQPERRYEVRAGDLLVTRANTLKLVGDACVVEDSRPRLMLPDLIYRLSVRHERAEARFLCYFLISHAGRAQIEADARGSSMSMAKISGSHLRSWTVSVPSSVALQRNIADFLDRKTASIDALIAKQEELLTLLAEKRQGLITQAVTKGLDPNVPMKDSGVQWIGKVPAHWTIRRLKHLGEIRSGIAKGRDVGDKATEALPYLRVANVQNGWLSLDDIDTIEVTQEEARRYALQGGDVLMNEGGDFDKLGRGYVWEGQIERCIHQNHVFAFRPAKDVDPYWVNLATQAEHLRHFFKLRSKQSTNLASISASNLGDAPVVMPPPSEVAALLVRIRRELDHLAALTQRTQSMVDKLREYRQALITAAVTGKLEVASDAGNHLEAVGA